MPVYDQEEKKLTPASDRFEPPKHAENSDNSGLNGDSFDPSSEESNYTGNDTDSDMKDTPLEGGNEPTATGPEQVDYYRGDSGKNSLSTVNGLVSGVKSVGKKRLVLGIIGPIGLIIILFILMGMLKIPNYAANIAAYRLARSAMTYAKTSAEIDAQKIALDSTDNGILKQKYGEVRGATWGKLDKYRPAKVIENLKSGGRLEYVEGGISKKIVAVKINGEYIFKSGDAGVLHPIQNYKARVEFAAKVDARLSEALRGSNTLIRGKTAKQIRANLRINLNAWEKLGKTYRNARAAEADKLQMEELERKTSRKPAKGPKTTALKNAVSDIENALKTCKNTSECRAKLFNGEIPDEIKQAMDKGVAKAAGETLGSKVLGIANTLFAIAVPACLIFDGSLEESYSDIDAQSDSATATFYALTSAADQQKAGDTTAEAVGALNRKIGDGDSTPDQYMRGAETDTSVQKSPQASIGGSFSLANALIGNNSVSSAINHIAETFCPTLTDVKTMVGVTILTLLGKILLGLFTGGVGTVAEQAGEEVVKQSIATIIKNTLKQKFFGTLEKIAIRTAVKNTVEVVTKGIWGFGKKFFRDFVSISAATVFARMVVLSKAGLINDGTTSANSDFKDTADMGGDLHNNELNRQMFYGAPLTDEEVALNDIQIASYLDNQEKTKPAYERFFATSNPRSLVSKISYQLAYMKNVKSGQLVYDFFASVNLSNLSNVFFPSNKYALAADATVNSHYGVVQWGWTGREETLINNNETYGVLENAQIVEAATEVISEIETKYGACFSNTMGTLLSEGKIVRGEDGDVVEAEGDCSPQNLGPNNPTYGDMVFRYRLYKKRENVLEHNMGIQEPTADTAATPTGAVLGGSCEGLVLEKATERKGSIDVVNDHDQYKLPSDGPGYYIAHPDRRDANWGSKELVETIYQVGKKWAEKHPSGPTFGVGDLDEPPRAPGDRDPHETHDHGLNVDIVGCPFFHECSNYDRSLSIELAKMFFEAGNINSILYNDESVISASNAFAKQNGLPGTMSDHPRHWDHFHVTILKGQAPEGCN